MKNTYVKLALLIIYLVFLVSVAWLVTLGINKIHLKIFN